MKGNTDNWTELLRPVEWEIELSRKQKALWEIKNAFDTYFDKFGCYPTIQFEASNYERIKGIKAQLITDYDANEVYLLMKEN